MKIIGAFFVFAAFFSCGLISWREKKLRLETLGELCFSLELISSELMTRVTPLPELAELLSKRSGAAAAAFFTGVYTALPQLGRLELSSLWCEAADRSLKCLRADELNEIKKLGYIIGRYELLEQVSAVKACLEYLRAHRDAAQAGSAEDKRLSLGLTAAAGALLAIVFI